MKASLLKQLSLAWLISAAGCTHAGAGAGPAAGVPPAGGLLESPDQRLLDAGCEAVRELPSLVERLRAHLKAATLRHLENATGMVGARLRLLREALALATAEDPDLKAAVCQRFSELIVDCS